MQQAAANSYLHFEGPVILRGRLHAMDGDWMEEARNGTIELLDRYHFLCISCEYLIRGNGLCVDCAPIDARRTVRLPLVSEAFSKVNRAAAEDFQVRQILCRRPARELAQHFHRQVHSCADPANCQLGEAFCRPLDSVSKIRRARKVRSRNSRTTAPRPKIAGAGETINTGTP